MSFRACKQSLFNNYLFNGFQFLLPDLLSEFNPHLHNYLRHKAAAFSFLKFVRDLGKVNWHEFTGQNTASSESLFRARRID